MTPPASSRTTRRRRPSTTCSSNSEGWNQVEARSDLKISRSSCSASRRTRRGGPLGGLTGLGLGAEGAASAGGHPPARPRACRCKASWHAAPDPVTRACSQRGCWGMTPSCPPRSAVERASTAGGRLARLSHEDARAGHVWRPAGPSGRGWRPMRDWTARTQKAVPVRPRQPCEISGARSRLDGATLGGPSPGEPQRVVRKPLPMRSHFETKKRAPPGALFLYPFTGSIV